MTSGDTKGMLLDARHVSMNFFLSGSGVLYSAFPVRQLVTTISHFIGER